MTSPEDNRTATTTTITINQTPSGGVPLPQTATTSGVVIQDDPAKTYVFGVTQTATPAQPVQNLLEPPRGHSRSVSHGGGVTTPRSRPSALKSSIRGGHQRALSQGQIADNLTPPRSGHTRTGSKTDFILPPGHKEVPPRDIGSGQSTTTASGTGHSRQASRSESIYTLRRVDLPPWWKRLISRRSKFDDYGFRLVVPNHTVPAKTPKRDHPNGAHCGNKIRTTKYTLLSFIPKNLLEQFHRVANLYFIFIVLLNWFPQINAFGKEIAMIPVLFVLGVTGIKDLFEDRRRRASDKRINNTTCRVYHGESERYRKVLWQDIRVGDLVHLSNNETVPADILLLRTSDPHGVCYIDTCDLDGETNLKRRQVVRGFAEKQIVFSPNKFVSKLEVDTPSTKIYRFHGAMIHPSGERVPVATESLLLRESRLKNTDFVEGICVYAGHETKAMLNNSGPRYKRSQLEQQMNIDVIWCVIILIILCVIGAVGCRMWLGSYTDQPIPFLPFDIDPNYEGLLSFWTFVIILQIMIPLSLYVTIELCKIFQVHLIHNNIELFDKQTNKRPECRAMNITEELGQIQYIFSDKTGTLTENKMIFRRCTINGIDYNHPKMPEEDILPLGSPALPLRPNLKLREDLLGVDSVERNYPCNSKKIHDFFLVLALCNTVVVSATPHKDIMNASGVIEEQSLLDESNLSVASQQSTLRNRVTLVKPTELTNVTAAGNTSHSNNSSLVSDRYARLNESRSVTPSPPPPSTLSLSLKTQHIPSLSPISSSAESSPESESPKLKIKSAVTTPTERVRSIVSKLPCVPTLLTNISNKKFAMNVKRKIQGASKMTSPLLPHQKPIYEAESPDELALVNAAYAYECILVNRGPQHVLVSTVAENALREYEILKVLPFDSTRKKMSIVVRRSGSQEIVLYTKGADSAIMAALSACPHFNIEEMRLRELTQQQLDLYARQGLRVLVMAKRTLKASEFSEWFAKHQEAEMSVESRERKIRESFNLLERNLTLLGATGIEDRLQEGVPETIHSLLSAGIVIWVLTGDKTETAVNVAYSAKLFHSQMEILKLTARSRDSAESSIMFYLTEIEKQLNGDCIRSQNKARALVVDGKTLTFILDLRSNLTRPFLRLTKYCSSVLCCRATPLQKAFLVKVVKEELRMSTLAIGDGANDVSMIQMADVGVGVCGQEGTQAVMASDFSLAKFKILERLLLVHGHWNYDRLARMITYFFYKNAAFVFLLFWFQLYCGFSGSVMIDEVYLMIYNFVFTSLPPLAIGVYDMKITQDLLLNVPRLYRHGRLSKAYKPHTFWIVMLDALYQSLVIFFVAEAAYWDSDIGIWEFGTIITSSCLITMSLHCAIEIRSWTILHVASIVISLMSFYVFAFFYNSVCVSCMNLPSNYWVIHMVMGDIKYYLIIVLTAVLALLPRFTFRVIENTMFPSDAMKIVIQTKLNQRRGENLLVASWSRSTSDNDIGTSASSIYRTSDYGTKNKVVTTIG